MVGQKKLLAKINSYTVDTFPRSLLLVGEKGCGKHTLVKYISENIVRFPILDATENISDEYIDAIYRNPNPCIYLIDLNEFTEKEQNILLKFVEEPLLNSFIILLSETKSNILSTILNRCMVLEFEQYSNEELSGFMESGADINLISNVLHTPGKIINTNVNNLLAMQDVCEKITTKLSVANFSNALTIGSKINYKDEYDKFDIEIFFDMLSFTMFNAYLKSNDVKVYKLYLTTLKYRKKLIDKRINKEYFMQNFLTNLWKESRI